MTLNITVATSRVIYQCADFRLLDLQTGKTNDFEAQKIVFANKAHWSATICFAGIGKTASVDVYTWLYGKVAELPFNAPFNALLDALLSADEWIALAVPPDNKHSFSVGAFVGSEALVALVSNFEKLNGELIGETLPALQTETMKPDAPFILTSGQRAAVTQPIRRRLKELVERHSTAEAMFNALAEANREAALTTSRISPSCFTSYVRNTGEGGGRPHSVEHRPMMPVIAVNPELDVMVSAILDEQFGQGGYQLRQFGSARSESTDQHHQTQLREKPNDPNSHSNYGAFLFDKKGDLAGAERAYQRALELEPNHTNALGNLALVHEAHGKFAEAETNYRQTIRKPGMGNETAAYNYAHFLSKVERHDDSLAIVGEALVHYPQSARLHVGRIDQLVALKRAQEALSFIEIARQLGGDSASIENANALALHLAGAPLGDTIAAYRTAIGLNPDCAELKLNLAQLLFLKGNSATAFELLNEAIRGNISESAQLEAQLYLLCHSTYDAVELVRAIESLLAKGARLNWVVQNNIELSKLHDARRGALAEAMARVMAGKYEKSLIDIALATYRASH